MERKSEMLAVAPEGATEGEVISEKLSAAIEALRERRMGKKAMARELGLDIKTVRKWCRQSWRPQARRPRGRRLARWEPFLRGRALEVEFNAVVLQRELAELGVTCSYRAVAHAEDRAGDGQSRVGLARRSIERAVHRLDLGQGDRGDLEAADLRKDGAAKKTVELGGGRKLAAPGAGGGALPQVGEVELRDIGDRCSLLTGRTLAGGRIAAGPDLRIRVRALIRASSSVKAPNCSIVTRRVRPRCLYW
jgi:hypothetical protein